LFIIHTQQDMSYLVHCLIILSRAWQTCASGILLWLRVRKI
jgi:hypothetical protein